MSQKSLLHLIETGQIKENTKKVMLNLREEPYMRLMDIIHDKSKAEDKRMAFNTLVDILIQAIIEDKLIILDERVEE